MQRLFIPLLGTLAAGNYVITCHETFSLRVIDGGDYDGDGILDWWEGTFRENSFTIVVQ